MSRLLIVLLLLALLGCSGQVQATVPTPTPMPTYGKIALDELHLFIVADREVVTLLKAENFGTAAWMAEIKETVAKFQTTHDNLNALQPPSQNADLHKRLLTTVAQCRDAGNTLIAGLEQDNQTIFNTAVDALTACFADMTPLVAELQAL